MNLFNEVGSLVKIFIKSTATKQEKMYNIMNKKPMAEQRYKSLEYSKKHSKAPLLFWHLPSHLTF